MLFLNIMKSFKQRDFRGGDAYRMEGTIIKKVIHLFLN